MPWAKLADEGTYDCLNSTVVLDGAEIARIVHGSILPVPLYEDAESAIFRYGSKVVARITDLDACGSALFGFVPDGCYAGIAERGAELAPIFCKAICTPWALVSAFITERRLRPKRPS